ncbi:MAG: DUF945 family protein [Halothiobacillus sp.]
MNNFPQLTRPRRWPWRMAALLLLLAALWGYVIPYQSGVRLDKALAAWAAMHPDWQLVRLAQSPYQRDYQLIRHSRSSNAVLTLDICLKSQPPGWPNVMGNQWGWAGFELMLDPESRVQIQSLPITPRASPLRVNGLVDWLGRLHFYLADSPHAGSLILNTVQNSWQGSLDVPGWTLRIGTADYLFGRTALDVDVQTHTEQGVMAWRGLDGEIGIDIRRLGWVASGQRGLIDHIQLRLRQTPSDNGKQRTIAGSCTLDSVQVNQQPWGGGQLAFAIDDAEPEFIGHLATLITDMQTQLASHAAASTKMPDTLHLAHMLRALPQDTLPAVLVALRAAEVRLGALRWHGPSGQFELSGQAFGPRFAADTAPQVEGKIAGPTQLIWQVHAQLREATTSDSPSGAPVNISYSADGWQINGRPVDSSAIFP